MYKPFRAGSWKSANEPQVLPRFEASSLASWSIISGKRLLGVLQDLTAVEGAIPERSGNLDMNRPRAIGLTSLKECCEHS
jgi:hypothetical protein